MTELLQEYQAFNQDLSTSFKTASIVQQNASTNAETLGQYISYIKGCNSTKFKNAIKKQHDAMKQTNGKIEDIQKQINDLLEQQNTLKSKKNTIIQTIKQLKSNKNKNSDNIQKLMDKQKECVQNATKSTNVLNRYLSQNKEIFHEIHQRKLKEFENEYKKWDKTATILWIMMIDDQRFSSNHKYSKFRKMLNKSGINGKSLNDLKSDLFLKYVGLGIESRTALINNINRVMLQNEERNDDDNKTQ